MLRRAAGEDRPVQIAQALSVIFSATPGGHIISVNCGAAGWVSDARHDRYDLLERGTPWPHADRVLRDGLRCSGGGL